MTKIFIAILVVVVIFIVLLAFACCRAAGWADEKMEEIRRESIDQEKTC